MPLEQIPEQEIRDTLERAQEIAQGRSSPGESDLDGFLQAAEELGIPREATLQALRERRLIPLKPLTPGDIVFAPSEDGNLYAATVLSVDGASVTLRFVNGGDRTCPVGDVRPLSFTPGGTVQYKYQGFGWISGKVSRCEPTTRTVWLTSVWDEQERELPLSQVRLSPRTSPRASTKALIWKVGLAFGAGGTLLGILLDHLLR